MAGKKSERLSGEDQKIFDSVFGLFNEAVKGANELDETPQQKEQREAREALRRHNAQMMHRAYTRALEDTDGSFFISAPYITAGFFGLLADAAHTLCDVVKDVSQSSGVQEIVEEEVGPGKTLVDLAVKKIGGKDSKKLRQSLNKIFDRQKKYDATVEALVQYSRATGTSPDAVVEAPMCMVDVIRNAYGSFAAYEKEQNKSLRGYKKIQEDIDKMKTSPVDIIVQTWLRSKLQGLEEVVGIKPAVLGKIAKEYVADAITFLKALTSAYEREVKKEFEAYKSALAIE